MYGILVAAEFNTDCMVARLGSFFLDGGHINLIFSAIESAPSSACDRG
jgi:hypothetical protein